MAKYSAAQARARFNEVLEQAKHEAVEIDKHGKPAVVILDAMKYENFLDYVEDLADRVTILETKLDPDPDWKSWEEAKRDLGWE